MSVFRDLLVTLKTSLERHTYEHIGSSQLWSNHWEALKLMSSTLENFDILKTSTNVALRRQLNSKIHPQPVSTSMSAKDESDDNISANVPTTLETLPPECLSRILSNVHSPVDLEAAARASPSLALVINDDLLWKHLAIMNFTPSQIMSVRYGRASWREDKPVTIKECNWRRAYMRLMRMYGEQQVHSASLGFCEVCSCLFWMLLGHTCLRESQPSKVRPLSPEDFVSMFSA
ncbi:F-box only protein 32 [Sparganum proliferum]